ncbi:MAG: glycosyltransferase family 2 protein [Pseudomonadota bacterium]
MTRISAIVVSYFTGPLLNRSIEALRAQDPVDEIILIDNGNPKGAVARAIEGAGAPVIVLSGQGNVGFAAACNKGAQIAGGEYLLFVNPDAVLEAGAAARLISDAATLARPWLVGAKIVDPDGAEQQGSRRNALTPARAIGELLRLDRFGGEERRFNLHETPCPEEMVEMPVISGACFLVPSKDFHDIGGMDERYFLHVEDVDFCRRFSENGGRVYFNPNVRVVHFKGSSRSSRAGVEAMKAKSLSRYFHAHFSENYPAPALWAIDGLLWSAFAARAGLGAMRWIARGTVFFLRNGPRGMARARSMARRRKALRNNS